MNPVAIVASGMVTPVGFTAAASCAAMRSTIDAFAETQFQFDGERLMGAVVPFREGWRGREKLLRMVVPAISQCLPKGQPTLEIALLLCVAEDDRAGRAPALDAGLLREIEERLQRRFSPASRVLSGGRMAGIDAVAGASDLIAGGATACVVAGMDSLLVGPSLTALHEANRLKTEWNSDGFIPGEAGAAVLLAPGTTAGSRLACVGLGRGRETATIQSEAPLRGYGLAQALSGALSTASSSWADVDLRLADLNGEQYGFKEATLALTASMRVRKQELDVWHPADSIGEVGAAIVPVVLGLALHAVEKGCAPGPGILCHFSADTEHRGALLLRALGQGA